MSRVGIVGGGVSGLMTAWELSQMGFEVDLFEASSQLGGLATSFDFDGFRVERFYHFICQSDTTLLDTIDRTGLSSSLRWRKTKTALYFNGDMHRFGTPLDLLRFGPLSLSQKLRFGWSVLRASRRENWMELENTPAKEWLIESIGERAYSVIWDPLLRVKFDQYHDEISAAWMWHRIHRVARSRKTPFHAEKFGYLEGGSDTLIGELERQARQHGARIHLDAPVEKILSENGTVVGLRSEGENHVFDDVILAAPMARVPSMLPDDRPAYRAQLESLRSIGVVCMILKLRESISNNFWLNVHDERIAFNGVVEYSRLNKDPRLGGSHLAYIPFYLEPSHPRFSTPDEELFAEYSKALGYIQPRFDPSWVEGYRVFRAPHAQPICDLGFSMRVPEIQTPWPNLFLVESTQLYPADRIISGNLRLAQDAVTHVVNKRRPGMDLPFAARAADQIPC